MAALFTSAVQAAGHDSQRDEQAVAVLKAMSTHLAGLKSVGIIRRQTPDVVESHFVI